MWIPILFGMSLLLGVAAAAQDDAEAERKKAVEAQKKMAADQWTMALPGKAMQRKETDNFLVFGSVDPKVIDQVAAGAEKAMAMIRKASRIDAKEELWPGKMLIHVIREKNDYNTFVRMVEKRSPQREEQGCFAHGREASYLIVAPLGVGKRYPLDVEVAQQLAAATMSKKAARVPDWLVNGFSRSIAYRYAPSQFADERRRAVQLVRQGRTAKDVWSGKLSFDEAVVLNASLVDYLVNNPQTQKVFPDLLAGSTDEAGFEEVLKGLKLSPDGVDAGWRRWVPSPR